MDYTVHGILQVRVLEWVLKGSLSLLQGIFPTQGSNPGLPHCWQILYQLSHKGSPRILEWIVYPFFSGSSQPRNQTGVSCIAGRFFTNYQGSPYFSERNYSLSIIFSVCPSFPLSYTMYSYYKVKLIFKVHSHITSHIIHSVVHSVTLVGVSQRKKTNAEFHIYSQKRLWHHRQILYLLSYERSSWLYSLASTKAVC